MHLLKTYLIGLLFCGFLFETVSLGQYIQTRGSYPIWKQFTPINVYHSRTIQQPIWQRYSSINVYHYRNVSNSPVSISTWHDRAPARPLVTTADRMGGIAAQTHYAAPVASEIANTIPGTVAANPKRTVDVANGDEPPTKAVSVIEIPSAIVPAGEQASETRAQPEDVGGQDPEPKSKLKVGYPAATKNEDRNAEKIRRLENDLIRSTKDLAKVKQDRDKLRKFVQQLLSNEIKEKKKRDQVANQIETLIAQNKELQALNKQLQQVSEASTLEQQTLAKQLAEVREALAKALAGKASNASNDGPMTLGELAEIKRRERKAQPVANTKPTAESLRADMEAELARAMDTIRNRFQKKKERAREQGNGNELNAKLDDEMKLQIEKMKERIENRYLRRIESARRKSNK